MRHLVDNRKLGRTANHRKALLRNMVTSLILSERIETTLPKAKELRRWADHMITLGKEGTLHARRKAASILQDPEAVKKLFNGLAARFTNRQGGYTRIYKFGFRRGDAAEMAAIEYLGYELPAQTEKGEKKKEEKKPEPKPEKKVKAKTEKKAKPEKKAEKATKPAPKKATKEKVEKKTKKTDKDATKKWGLFGRKGTDK